MKGQKYTRKCQHWLVKRQAQLQTALGHHFTAAGEVKSAITDICADMMWHPVSVQGLLIEEKRYRDILRSNLEMSYKTMYRP